MRAAWLALSLSLCTVAPAASAWTDARPAGLVTEVVVDRDGGATVTLRVRWRVVAGRFRAFDLTELPADAALVEATATDAQGAPVVVSSRAPQPGRLELSLGEREGLRRGTVDVVVRYTTSLRAQGAIRRSGDDAIVEVSTVPWERGLEAAELRVATPTSIQRARWVADETPGIETAVSSEVGRDVVRAVRRHLPSGVRWTGRIACDRALFPWLEAPAAAPMSEVRAAERERWAQPSIAALAALAFAAMAKKIRKVDAERPRLVPLHRRVGWAPIALAAMGGAMMALALDATRGALTLGAMVALAGLVSAAPTLDALPPPRQGRASRWSDERVSAAILPAKSSLWKKWALLVASSALAWAGYVSRSSPAALVGVASSVALLAWIIATRDRSVRGDLPVLREVERSLGLAKNASSRPVWKVRDDGQGVGAARLKLAPKVGFRAQKGLDAIEWSVGWSPSLLRWQASPVLTVRARKGTTMEKTLRLAATKAGRVVSSTDGAKVAWVVAWSGAERSVAREALAKIVRDSFVAAKDATNTQGDAAVSLAPSADASATVA
jgi:hypothetical protein